MRVLALLVLLTIFSTASAACDDGYSGANCDVENKSPGDYMQTVMPPYWAQYNNFDTTTCETTADCQTALGQTPSPQMYSCVHYTLGLEGKMFEQQFVANKMEHLHNACKGPTTSPFILHAVFVYLKNIKDNMDDQHTQMLGAWNTCSNISEAFCIAMGVSQPVAMSVFFENVYTNMVASAGDPAVCPTAISNIITQLQQQAAQNAGQRRRI